MNIPALKKYITIGLIALMALFSGVWTINAHDTQAALKVQYDAKLVDNNAQFDNMWKTISQIAQIPEAKKNAYKEIFEGYANARTSEGQGRVMAWIKEQNPTIDLSVYDKLSDRIEANRKEWTGHQTRLVFITEQYNKNLSPLIRGGVLKLMGFEVLKAEIVTSSHTKKSFSSGLDDDIKLFPAKK